MLYACDTGRFFEQTMTFLQKYHVDILIIEGSFGRRSLPKDSGHLNFEFLCDMLDQMFKQETLTEESRVYATHIGHKGEYNLADYQAALHELYQEQVQVAWDGLKIEF